MLFKRVASSLIARQHSDCLKELVERVKYSETRVNASPAGCDLSNFIKSKRSHRSRLANESCTTLSPYHTGRTLTAVNTLCLMQ